MSEPATTTRERILRHGLALMSQAGLAGGTLGQLAEQVGMSKSGVFAHFRSKEDGQIGLLDHMAQIPSAHVVHPALSVAEGLPRLEAPVHNWLGWAKRGGPPAGGPTGA